MVLWKTYIKKKNLIMLILKKLNYYILLYQQKKEFNCFIYFMKENIISKQGKPSNKYMNNITTAAAIYNFPISYIQNHLNYNFDK